MRRPARRLRALVAALALAGAAQALAVEPGEPAPEFALPTAGGEIIALDRLRGQVVYVDFWASWCGPCRRSFPWMNEMHRKYGGKGLAIVAINVDRKRADAQRFLAQTPAEFTIVYDAPGAAPAAYAVKGMPSSYLINAGGKVVAVERGFRDRSSAMLEQRIRALLGP
jgi:thiol-disulfide isomerase/thioredoxin